ncbi:hypothetical protein M0534_05990 [Methylonatrum kenyense]|uniref:hypothetical protein n=1 Tax=Methylonatrum kenyense TaxID=455253 RepID=UPI0020BF5D96|nr:hypothetical protein [Methylonatrum kenyense]MCK8515875.1 hypothetical protein [Methylonatrum kenyense]
MMVLAIWNHGIWLFQMRGLAVLLKLGLLAVLLLLPAFAPTIFLLIIVLSGVFSHAPAYVRYYSPWHRRVVHAPE